MAPNRRNIPKIQAKPPPDHPQTGSFSPHFIHFVLNSGRSPCKNLQRRGTLAPKTPLTARITPIHCSVRKLCVQCACSMLEMCSTKRRDRTEKSFIRRSHKLHKIPKLHNTDPEALRIRTEGYPDDARAPTVRPDQPPADQADTHARRIVKGVESRRGAGGFGCGGFPRVRARPPRPPSSVLPAAPRPALSPAGHASRQPRRPRHAGHAISPG